MTLTAVVALQMYDLLLFGVTGFTGKLAAEYLKERNYPEWAVCGRNEEKVLLESRINQIAEELGKSNCMRCTAIQKSEK